MLNNLLWTLVFPLLITGVVAPIWLASYLQLRQHVLATGKTTPAIDWTQGLLAWGIVIVYRIVERTGFRWWRLRQLLLLGLALVLLLSTVFPLKGQWLLPLWGSVALLIAWRWLR
jgi:hypothetical protein